MFGGFLEGFYILGHCDISRKAVSEGLDGDGLGGMHPPVPFSPIDSGSLVTTMPSPIGVGSLGIPDNLTILQPFPPDMKPLEALHTFGVTADSPVNTHSAGEPLDDYAGQLMGKRLDYVLYRPPVHSLKKLIVLINVHCTPLVNFFKAVRQVPREGERKHDY